MKNKESNNKTCGAHDEECTNWCGIHKIWECDQCYNAEWQQRNKILQEKQKKWDFRRNFFMAKIEAKEMMGYGI